MSGVTMNKPSAVGSASSGHVVSPSLSDVADLRTRRTDAWLATLPPQRRSQCLQQMYMMPEFSSQPLYNQHFFDPETDNPIHRMLVGTTSGKSSNAKTNTSKKRPLQPSSPKKPSTPIASPAKNIARSNVHKVSSPVSDSQNSTSRPSPVKRNSPAKRALLAQSTASASEGPCRGVTMRPSGKWQAQMYFAGKSRYIGVFDLREKAYLGYEIARKLLKEYDMQEHKQKSPQEYAAIVEKHVNAARRAAYKGINAAFGCDEIVPH